MSHVRLRRLVGMALVDRDFCHDLMNGRRSALLAAFELSDEEREVVASSDTASARELASAVHSWLKEQGDVVAPPVDGSTVQVL
jgi:hypothetical protein